MQTERTKKKKTPMWGIWAFIAIIAFNFVDEIDGELGSIILGIVLLLLPIVALFLVVRAVLKAGSRTGEKQHSHDRIDHSSDLKINPATGRAEPRAVNRAAQHSPREHWKEQLDGLLANGTIDRAEYRALMKRKF